jgi:hypothetical protein
VEIPPSTPLHMVDHGDHALVQPWLTAGGKRLVIRPLHACRTALVTGPNGNNVTCRAGHPVQDPNGSVGQRLT